MHYAGDFVELDVKDRKILLELDFSARMPLSRLARRVGISQQGVDYRIKRLVDNGIIERFYPVINTAKLGYLLCRLFISFYNVTEKVENEIVSYLKKEDMVNWLGKVEGRYDIALSLWIRDLPDFLYFINKFLTKYGKYVKERKEGVGIIVYLLKRNYLLPEFRSESIRIAAQSRNKYVLDGLDKKIITALCHNARLPVVEIAKKIRAAPHTVAYRMEKLEKERVILGYRPNINVHKLGYTDYKVHLYLAGAAEKEIENLVSYLERHPNVTFILIGIGAADVDFELMVKSDKEFISFMKKLKTSFPKIIRNYEFMILVEMAKVGFMPPYDM